MPSDVEIAPQEKAKFATHLIDVLTARASGASESVCLYSMPKDKYFIGSLRPRPLPDEANPHNDNFINELLDKLAPVGFGTEFRLELGMPASFEFELSWNVYYRIFPTLAEQREIQHLAALVEPEQEPSGESNLDEKEEEKTDEEVTANPSVAATPLPSQVRKTPRVQSDTLLPKFKRIHCRAKANVALTRRNNAESPVLANLDLVKAAIASEFGRARAELLADPERIRVGADPEEQIRASTADLASEAAFQTFKARFTTEINPSWNWEIAMTSRSETDSVAILETMATNVSAVDVKAWHSEAYFFDVQARYSFAGIKVIPFEIESAPKSFRYDPFVVGRGLNCTVIQGNEDNLFLTSNVPLYAQNRYSTNSQPKAGFED